MLTASGDVRRIGPDEVAGFARDVLASARAFEPTHVVRRTVAGLPMEVGFGRTVLRQRYAGRFGLPDATSRDPAARFRVLETGELGLPHIRWAPEEPLDEAPRIFQTLMAEAGIAAAYPAPAMGWRLFDPADRFGVLLVNDPDGLQPWDAGAPLLAPLRYALAGEGLRITHAGTLARGGRGVLLAGDGGAGKSATTLAGIAAGLGTVGDDYVAVATGERLVARPLFHLFKQDPAGLRRLGGSATRLADRPVNWQGKIELDPDELRPGAFVEEMEVGAILLPRIAGADASSFAPATAAEAMHAMIRTNLLQFPGERENGLAFFAGLLNRVPCYRLDLAVDAMANGQAIARFIDEQLP